MLDFNKTCQFVDVSMFIYVAINCKEKTKFNYLKYFYIKSKWPAKIVAYLRDIQNH